MTIRTRQPRWRVRSGDILEQDTTQKRYRTLSVLVDELLLQPLGSRDPLDFITLPISQLDEWTIVRPPRWKEVSSMARPATNLPKPPKMTKSEWLKREKTKVSLTRGELEQLAQLVAAGHALIRDGRSISPKLKAAMSRLGIKTHGL